MIKNRIIQILENKGIAKEIFYKKIGMTSANFRGEAKKTPLNSTAIENILSEIPEINPDWLLTGKGEMLRGIPVIAKGIPVYDLPVSAGELGVVELGSHTPVAYSTLPIFEGCHAILPIIGVSMEPEIYQGDLIGISPLNTPIAWEYLNTTARYLIITRHERMIKYISSTDNPDYITCTSPNAQPFRVAKEDIIHIYSVRAVARRFQ